MSASSLDIWSVLILISLAHSIFVINLLFIKKEHKKTEGKWLLGLMGALIWLQLEFLSIRWPYDVGVGIFYGTRFGSWMLIGPLFYFFLRAITGHKAQKNDCIQFVPFIMIALVVPTILSDFLSYRQVHYGMLTPFDPRPDQISLIQYFYSGVFLFQFFHLLYFLSLGRRLISNYKKNLKDNYSNMSWDTVKWLDIFWYGMASILVLATGFIVLLFFSEAYRRWSDYSYVLPMSVLVYMISYKLAGVKWVKVEIETSSKYAKSNLGDLDVENYKRQLHELFADKQLYLNQELRLQDLANELQISAHQLSQLLNQHMQTTFFDLVNKYRVDEAKRRILKDQQYTLLQIAFESGFNNKTSFVNAFKRYEGKTPSQFLKKSA